MADKPSKGNKLRARLPRGLADRGPADILATRRMLDTIRAVYERYGFGRVGMRKNYYPAHAGQREDAVVMSFRL